MRHVLKCELPWLGAASPNMVAIGVVWVRLGLSLTICIVVAHPSGRYDS
jgi:hypothetical protein